MNTEALKDAAANYNSGPWFEGESLATLYYWHTMLDGDGDMLGDGFTLFDIDEEEAQAFGLTYGNHYLIHERTDGFVSGRELTQCELRSHPLRALLGRGYRKSGAPRQQEDQTALGDASVRNSADLTKKKRSRKT